MEINQQLDESQSQVKKNYPLKVRYRTTIKAKREVRKSNYSDKVMS